MWIQRFRNFQWKKFSVGRLPLKRIFLAGFLLGILMMYLGKSIFMEGTGLLDEYVLYHMKYMTIDSKALFIYVLWKRLAVLLFLGIAATTYLGLAVLGAAAGWFGLLLGMLLSTTVLRYGLKGIVLALVSLFPQFLLYLPGMMVLMAWCEQLCRMIYFQGRNYPAGDGKRHISPEMILQLVFILTAIFVGCLLESYVNPVLLTGLLKIF